MPLKLALARTMALALMTNYGLRQNHRKIIGKTKKSAFCVPYSVPAFSADQLLILHVKSMFGKYGRGVAATVAACMYF
jgi:hypothetical protein